MYDKGKGYEDQLKKIKGCYLIHKPGLFIGSIKYTFSIMVKHHNWKLHLIREKLPHTMEEVLSLYIGSTSLL